MNPKDTIYALASGSGTVALSVIRLSGDRSHLAGKALAGELDMARRCYLRTLRDPVTREVLDQAMVVRFDAPASFTGEDGAEFHIHGGRAVQSGVLLALSRLDGLRLAEPGEFTRRAIRNGKMDLVEAEGLGDLLWAQTSGQRRQAMSQLLGEASSVFESWREHLLLIRAEIEAAVDFADEAGVAEAAQRGLDGRIQSLLSEMEQAVSRAAMASAIRDGVRVVLAGLPNTGKSRLLNALVRREAAIVSAIPGTTRDAIEVLLDLDGIPVILTDTAGLRDDVSDVIEAEGIRRSRARVEDAHVVVWVASPDVPGSEEYDQSSIPDILVRNKCDIAESNSILIRNEDSIRPHIILSATTGEGVEGFLRILTDLARQRFTSEESPLVVTERQRLVTLEAIESLKSSAMHGSGSLELKAEDIRRAADAVGRLTGRSDVEEWLGVIFSRFCIGK